MNKVELENITVRYGDHTVLDNFSLTIPEGKIIGIVGPSACGKTTVVRAICGFVNPETDTEPENDLCENGVSAQPYTIFAPPAVCFNVIV